MVQWLRLCLSMQEGTCLVRGWETNIPHALWPKKIKKKKKKYSLMLLLWTSSDVSVCPPPCPGGTPAYLPSSLSPQSSLPTSRALASPPKLHTCEKCNTSIA